MKKWLAFASILGLVLVIAACGTNAPANNNSGNGAGNKEVVDTGTEGATDLVISATNWKFDKEEYKIKAGEDVNLTLKSVGSVHGIAILKTDYTVKGNKTATVKIDEPGTYDIICNIQCGRGHRAMKAKLVVE